MSAPSQSENNVSDLITLLNYRKIVQPYPPAVAKSLLFDNNLEIVSTKVVEDYRHECHMDYEYFFEEPYYPESEQDPIHSDHEMEIEARSLLDSSSEGQRIPSLRSSVSSQKDQYLFKTAAKDDNSRQYISIHPPSLQHSLYDYQRHQQNKAPFNNEMDIAYNENNAYKEMQRGIQQDNKLGNTLRNIKDENIKSKTNKERVLRSEVEVLLSAQRLQKIKKLQTVGCNCRKSKCLKMYCECFNQQILCSKKCECVGCGNMAGSDDLHRKAVFEALTRNPRAFTLQHVPIKAVFDIGVELAQVKKGCRCKKTRCLKKYCECYNVDQKCGQFCLCEDCANK